MREAIREQAFETVIEDHLPRTGYARADRQGFDRERAIFPETVLAFIREAQLNPAAVTDQIDLEATA